MKQELAIGIDLGTSTSEVAIFKNNEPWVIPDPTWKVPIIPSLVAIDSKGELKVGEAARSYVDVPGQGAREVKRLMGSGDMVTLLGKTYRPEEISALILRKLKENAEEALGATINEVVLSVPANFPDAARYATSTAGELAGLKVTRLINEPTAAALAFGIKNIDAEEQLVIFDFGGGTLDISVCEMMAGILDVKCSYGDPNLGGKDIDEAVSDHFLRQFKKAHPNALISDRQLLTLKSFSERAKRTLSTQTHFSDILRYFAAHNGKMIDLEVELSRTEFNKILSPLMDKVRACITQALNAKKLRPSAVDRVLLVGGTTYIPLIRSVVAEMFGREPRTDVEPDLAVAMGACIQSAIAKGLINEETGIILTDVCPYGLGVDILSNVGDRLMLVYDPLITPNQHIPFSCKKEYSLIYADQTELRMHLYQDHQGNAQVPEDAIYTEIEAQINDIPPAADGIPHPVEVSFNYDINGMVKLTARIPATNQEVAVEHKISDIRMDEEQKQEAAAKLRDLWKMSAKAKQYEGIIEKAETLMDEVSIERRLQLSVAVTELKCALEKDDESQIERTGDALVDLMFELENELR